MKPCVWCKNPECPATTRQACMAIKKLKMAVGGLEYIVELKSSIPSWSCEVKFVAKQTLEKVREAQ